MSLVTSRLAVILCVVLAGCTPADPIQKISGPAQGASYNISYWSEQPVDRARLQKQIEAEPGRTR